MRHEMRRQADLKMAATEADLAAKREWLDNAIAARFDELTQARNHTPAITPQPPQK